MRTWFCTRLWQTVRVDEKEAANELVECLSLMLDLMEDYEDVLAREHGYS